MIFLVMIKSYLENLKARKKWKLNRQNDFEGWQEQQFTRGYIDGQASKNDIDTIIFQYWESGKLISTFISPIGLYCRHIIPEDFIRWPINDALVKQPALILKDQLKVLAKKLHQSKLIAIPKNGFFAIHLLTENGWQSTEMLQSAASLLPEWQKAIEMEKQVAILYQKQLPLHDRDSIGIKN